MKLFAKMKDIDYRHYICATLTACVVYGFYNVGGVYVDNEQNREYLRLQGKTEM